VRRQLSVSCDASVIINSVH